MENENGPEAAKKRKLLTAENSSLYGIQLEVKKFENQKLKEHIEKLDDKIQKYMEEINELRTKILYMEDTVKNLQDQNENSKTEIDSLKSIIDKNNATIKAFEDEKQEFQIKNKELAEEIAIMKTIKSEIKDTVEEERETLQATIDNLKAETEELKNKNCDLEKHVSIGLTQKEELEKYYNILNSTHQELLQKYKALETTKNEEKEKHQNTINSMNEMKALNDTLTKKNNDLINDKQVLQNVVDKKEKMIENLEKNDPETKCIIVKDIYRGTKLNRQLLKSNNKILNVAIIEGVQNGWNFYSSTDKSEKPCFIKFEDFNNTSFMLNIDGHLMIQKCGIQFYYLLFRINNSKLTKLCIMGQSMYYDDYCKLVSSKKVQIFVLEKASIKKTYGVSCKIPELLKELPNIEKFRYMCSDREFRYKTSNDFVKSEKCPRLRKFELQNLDHSFKLEHFSDFIKKNKNAQYILKFSDSASFKDIVKKDEKKLLKSLTFPCNLTVEFLENATLSLSSSSSSDSDIPLRHIPISLPSLRKNQTKTASSVSTSDSDSS